MTAARLEEPRLARADRRGAARARAADLRPAPPPLGPADRRACARATCSTRSWRTSRGGHNVVSTVFIECGAMFKPTGPEALRAGRRDRVRERHRGHERLRPLRPDAHRRRHRRHRRPAPGRCGGRRARRADRRRRRPLPRHPPRRGLGRRPRPSRTTAPTRARACSLRDDFRAGFTQLAPRKLSFEVWCYHPQIPDVTALARAFPDTTIILDHFGGPLGVGPYAGQRGGGLRATGSAYDRRAGDAAPTWWPSSAGINMEVNGFGWHERPRPPTSQELAEATRRYYEYTIERFGAERCMFESNFPVDKVSCSYTVLWNSFKRLAAGYSADGARPRSSTTRPRVSTGSRHEPQRPTSSARTWSCPPPPPACRCPTSRCPSRITCCSAACAFTISTGAPTGLPPVVFLHGGGLNAHTWDLVCAALRRERHCVALDQRGHGESEWSPEMDYATESHAADVGAFVDALKLERFVLVGMSLGGVERAGLGRAAQPAPGRAGPDRRRSRDPRRGRAQDRRVHLGGRRRSTRSSSSSSARSASTRGATASSCAAASCTTSAACPTAAACGSTTSATAARRSIPTPTRAGASSVVGGGRRRSVPTLVVRGAQSDVFHDEDAERLAGRFRQGRWVKDRGRRPHRAGRQPRRPARRAARVPGRGYGLISVVARLMTNASRRSKKSATISANASGRSAAMAGPAA